MRTRFGWVLAAAFLCLAGPRAALAQSPSLQWDDWFDDGGEDRTVATAQAADGGLFVAVITDHGTPGQSWQDLLRYTPTGGRRFHLHLGTQMSAIRHLAVDGAGNCYASGVFNNGTNRDARILKVSPTGAVLWSTRRDLGGDEVGTRIAVDAQGNAYQVLEQSNGQRSLSRFNSSSGAFQWAFNLEDQSDVFPLAGPEGTVYLAQNLPNSNVAFRRIHAGTGTQLWRTPFNTAFGCQIHDAAVDSTGSLVTAGGAGNGGAVRVWHTLRVLSTGTVNWSRAISPAAGGNGGDAFAVEIGPSNAIFLTGYWQDGTNDPTQAAVARFTHTGKLGFHTLVPDADYGAAWLIKVDGDGKSRLTFQINWVLHLVTLTVNGGVESHITHGVPGVFLEPQGMSLAPDGTVTIASSALSQAGNDVAIFGFR